MLARLAIAAAVALFALGTIIETATPADARGHARHWRRHHIDKPAAQVLRAQLGAMRVQIADLRRDLAGLRTSVQAAAQGPALVAPKPDEVPQAALPDPHAQRLAALPPAADPAPVDVAKPDDMAEVRAYLCTTAHPGGTMTRLGCAKAVGFLHPDFAAKLAAAVREARAGGMDSAGVYSAYRPPSYGVGGFSDKYLSLHSYGLAADMHGVGRPCSRQARQWHQIAARNGVAGPYGACNRAEWNHMQGTRSRVAPGGLRGTITAGGPLDPERMWDAAKGILATALDIVPSLYGERTRVRQHHRSARHRHPHRARVRYALR